MKLPTIRKLPSGNFNAQIQIDGRRVSVTSDTRKGVEREILDLKLNKRNLSRSGASDVLSVAIDKYIETKVNILSPSTVRGYGVIKRNRFQSVMSKKMDSITNWQAVVNAEAKLCTPKTLKNAWGLVRTVLRVNGIDPGDVLLPTVIRKERAWIEPDKIPLFLESIKGSPYEIAFLCCLHGLRASEMLALDKCDVGDEITVNKAIVQGSDHRLVLKHMTKNATSTRKVPVMIPRLTELVADRPEGRLNRHNSHTLNDHLKTCCESVGLPAVTLHELRHTYVSLMYHLGISEEQAMQFGGYSDRATMREIYTHLSKADRENAAESMRLFFKNGNESVNGIEQKVL